MNIIMMIYFAAKVLAIASLVIEVGVAAGSLFVISENNVRTFQAFDGIFASAVRVRNSALCFLALLFFLSGAETTVNGVSPLMAISELFRMYAAGSLLVLALGIISSIICAWKKILADDILSPGRRAWTTGMVSSIAGFALSHLLFIP